MNSVPKFDLAQAMSLRTYLDAPERTPDTMSYCEAAGFLFVVACAPEPIQPSQWIPLIVDPDNSTETSIQNMQEVTNGLFSLYNETIRQVQEADTKLPPGCDFIEEPIANLDPEASVSQWASGFRAGYLWLEKMWSEYIPLDIKEEAGHQMTVLCFFSNRQIATAFFDEVQNEEITFESMAASMQGIFPDAMRGFALLGHSIQQVVSKRHNKSQQPAVRGEKIGRNDPCHCGSGKKYKKCCGGVLH